MRAPKSHEDPYVLGQYGMFNASHHGCSSESSKYQVGYECNFWPETIIRKDVFYLHAGDAILK